MNTQNKNNNLFFLIFLIFSTSSAHATTTSTLLENKAYNTYDRKFDSGSSNHWHASDYLDTTGFNNSIARSHATADLASGSLHAYALAESPSRSYAKATAKLGDSLIFSKIDGFNFAGDDWVYATLHMNVHAIKSAYTGLIDPPNNGHVATLSVTSSADANNIVDLLSFNDVNGQTLVSQTLSVMFPIYHPLNDEMEQVSFSASLAAYVLATSSGGMGLINGLYSGQFDASNTAVLSIDLPEGFTYTSGSGVLLTSPVPVPAAVWLFGSSLLGLLGVARRKG